MAIQLGDDKLIFVLDDVLDVEAARRIAEAASAFGTREVVVDVRKVREIHDFGLVELVEQLGRTGARLELRGVSEQQRRRLRHLRLDPKTDLCA